MAHKNTQVFSHDKVENKQGECYFNERQPNSPEYANF